MMTIKRNFLTLLLLLMSVITGHQAFAESGSEAAVKTAFLYNFFKFIAWPEATSQQAFSLCTTDTDTLGDSLLVLNNKTIGNMPILIRRGISDKDLKNCNMIFISASGNTAAIIQNLKGLPIVTVSDKPGFVDQGGMIGLIEGDNRLSFEINLDAANAGSLHIGAQMLKLAKRVNTEK